MDQTNLLLHRLLHLLRPPLHLLRRHHRWPERRQRGARHHHRRVVRGLGVVGRSLGNVDISNLAEFFVLSINIVLSYLKLFLLNYF